MSKINEKIPVKYSENLAPFCPNCGSAEYMYNEDENENNFCGQCGTALNWEIWEDVEKGVLIDSKSNKIIRKL